MSTRVITNTTYVPIGLRYRFSYVVSCFCVFRNRRQWIQRVMLNSSWNLIETQYWEFHECWRKICIINCKICYNDESIKKHFIDYWAEVSCKP